MNDNDITDSKPEGRGSDEQPAGTPKSRLSPPNVGLRRLRAEAEIRAISDALEQVGWNRKRAAELLRISYRGLLYKIGQHNIRASSTLKPLSEYPESE